MSSRSLIGVIIIIAGSSAIKYGNGGKKLPRSLLACLLSPSVIDLLFLTNGGTLAKADLLSGSKNLAVFHILCCSATNLSQ